MSAGHHHSRPNMKHSAELRKLEAAPDFQRCWNRPFKVDDTKQIFDSAGYNVRGDVYYRDADLVRAIRSGKWVNPVTGHLYDVRVDGMSPDELLAHILRHERTEKCLLDADNLVNLYPDAHEFATLAEHEGVSSPRLYERALRPLIEYNQSKRLTRPALDLSCAPMLDNPDRNDREGLKQMRQAGNPDASKTPKKAVNYGLGKKNDICKNCAHRQPQPAPWNTQCEIVDGTILPEYWCSKFEAAAAAAPQTKGPTNGEAQRSPSGVQGSGSQDRPQPQDQEPRRSPGGGVPQGEPGREKGKPAPQAREGVRASSNGSVTPSAVTEPLRNVTEQPPVTETEPEQENEMDQRVVEALDRLTKAMESKPQQPVTLKIEHAQPPAPSAESPIGKDERQLLTTAITENRKTQVAVTAALAKVGEALEKIASREYNPPPITVKLEPPKKRKKKITTKRDQDGNLVAEVSEE